MINRQYIICQVYIMYITIVINIHIQWQRPDWTNAYTVLQYFLMQYTSIVIVNIVIENFSLKHH